MRIIKLMICDYIEQIKNNIISAILMSIVAVILVAFVSLYSFQYNRYKPFKSLNIKKGFFVTCDVYQDIRPENITNVEKIYRIRKDTGMVQIGNTDISIIGYEEWAWKYKPGRLAKGEWYTWESIEKLKNEGKIPVILSSNARDYNVGDDIELYVCSNYYDPDVETKKLNLYVTGIFAKDAGVMGDNNSFNISDRTYEAFYDLNTSMGGITNGKLDTTFFLPVEAVKEMGVEIPLSTKYFLEYKNSLSEEEVAKQNSELYGKTDGTGISMKDFLEWSDEKLNNIVETYLPFIITGLVIVLISLYSLANISIYRQAKRMGIYTIVGASRAHNYLLLFGNIIITDIISIVLSILGIELYKNIALKNDIYFEMNKICIIAIVVAYMFFLVFMSLSMYLAFRKKTTRGMLISLHK